MPVPTRPARKRNHDPERRQPAGTAELDDLLAAFDRCATTEARAQVGVRLATAGVRDDRVRKALVRMLDDDPLNAAAYLSALGDRRAARDLAIAADRLLASPIGDCELCQAEHLTAIATAIRTLGGKLSDEQLATIEAVVERAAQLWVPLQDHCSASPSGRPTAFVRREDGDDEGHLH